MICKNCNHEIEDGVEFCPNCGTRVDSQTQQTGNQYNQNTQQQFNNQYNPNAQQQFYAPPTPPTINQTPYLVWAILVTIFCCLPFGIPAIVYAAKINSALAMGNYQLALDSAKKSKMFSIISACVAAAIVVLYIIIFVILGVGALASSGYYSYY